MSQGAREIQITPNNTYLSYVYTYFERITLYPNFVLFFASLPHYSINNH